MCHQRGAMRCERAAPNANEGGSSHEEIHYHPCFDMPAGVDGGVCRCAGRRDARRTRGRGGKTNSRHAHEPDADYDHAEHGARSCNDRPAQSLMRQRKCTEYAGQRRVGAGIGVQSGWQGRYAIRRRTAAKFAQHRQRLAVRRRLFAPALTAARCRLQVDHNVRPEGGSIQRKRANENRAESGPVFFQQMTKP